MKSELQIRQGDVLLIKVDKLPKATKCKKVGNNHILAYGEASGHAHAIRHDHCELFAVNEEMLEIGKKYGINDNRAVTHGLRIVVDNTVLLHGTPTKDFRAPSDPDHTPINMPAGDYLVIRPREYSDDEEFKVVAD